MQTTLIIRFENATAADANLYARALYDELFDLDPSLSVARQRESPDTMDFGSTLVLVLGAPAVVAVARGLSNFLSRSNSGTLTIETKDRKFVARNVESANVAEILRAALSVGANDSH